MEVVPQQMSGVLSLVPNGQSSNEKVLPLEVLIAVVSMFAAGVRTASECVTIIEGVIGRELALEEVADLQAIAAHINSGSSVADKMARLLRVRNALNAIELNLGLNDSEVRQLAGI